MKNIILFLLLLFSASTFGQTLFSAGITYTNGAPVHDPGKTGSRYAVDTVAWNWYVRSYGTTWQLIGNNFPQDIAGCAAPAYTPTKFQSKVVINACDPPELYIWDGAAWDQIGAGGGITNGDKGDITVSSSGTVWDIDAGVVGPTELASTAVTPGSYTNTSLTVDADGRITAASSGSIPGTDLSFSGASSPVTLNSSTGTDVTITAGTGISLSATGTDLTITNTGGGISGTGLANRLAYWTAAGALGYPSWFKVDTTNRILTLGNTGQHAKISFADTVNNDVMIRLNGERFLHTIGSNTLIEYNTFLGYRAGASYSPVTGSGSGNNNTVFGSYAAENLTTSGISNTIFGSRSGRALTSGSNNTIVGVAAFEANTAATNIIAIGKDALRNSTSSAINGTVAIGANALSNASFSGAGNIAIGLNSSLAMTSGASNTAIGESALTALTTSSNNLAIGHLTANTMQTGGNNVILGASAGRGSTTGDQNVWIGISAGRTAATDIDGSVMIGYNVGRNSSTDNSLYIENSDSETPLIGGLFASNFVGINTTVANIDAALEVTGTGATNATMGFDVSNSNDSIIIAARNDRRVGINTATPDVSLDAGENTDAIKIPAGTTAQEPAVNNTLRFNTTREALEARENGVMYRLTSSRTPSVAAGVAAGTTPTIAVAGSDLAGKVTLTTGTGATTGALFTVTYASTLDAASNYYVTFSCADSDCPTLQLYVSAESNTSFTVSTVNAPADATQFIINYHVGQ